MKQQGHNGLPLLFLNTKNETGFVMRRGYLSMQSHILSSSAFTSHCVYYKPRTDAFQFDMRCERVAEKCQIVYESAPTESLFFE